jgi:hypothetical protein
MAIPGAVRLEYSYEKDETIRYRILITSEQTIVENGNSTAHNFQVESVMSATAFEIMGDDTYAIQYIIESGSITREEKTTRLPNVGQSFIMEMMKNGEVMRSSLNLPFTQPAFPDRAIEPGYSWEDVSDITFPFKDKSLHSPLLSLTYKYTLKELSTMAGQECAMLTVVCPETRITVKEDHDMDISGSGKIYFAHREGKLVGSYIKNTQLINTPGTVISGKISTKVELVP